MLLFLLIGPIAYHTYEGKPTVGGGGEGPAGGGGGGSRGGEHLQFVQIKQASAADVTAIVPVPKIVPPKVAVSKPVTLTPVPAPSSSAAPVSSVGAGEGTGGAGSGPGTGGGIGSGTGTGTGTGNGPGTGGGPGTSYPPTPTQFFLPPLPAPSSIRGYHLIAYFDVDERGNAKLLGFNPSRDGGYNRKLRDVLSALKFKPGVKADGTPVRDTVDIQFIF